MRKMLSLALAGTIAATAIAGSITTASAGKWQGGKSHYGYRHHHGPGPGAIAGAAIFGLALGALAAPMVSPPYPYGYSYGYTYYPPAPVAPYPAYAYNPHVSWCTAQYQSYNPATNTWVDFSGVIQICVSPY